MKWRRQEEGMISVEAGIVVPVFMILIMFVYGLILFFMGEQAMTHALIQCAESLSLDPLATEKLDPGDINNGADLLTALYAGVVSIGSDGFSSTEKWYSTGAVQMQETIKTRFLAYYGGTETNADDALKELGIKDGKDGLDFSESTISDGVLKIKLKYKQTLLFDFHGIGQLQRKQSVNVKLWGVN